jgi:hypothetical protein
VAAHAPLKVEVRDDEIIVTQSGSKFRAIYHSVHHKPGQQPQLIVKGTPRGNYDFLAQARASWGGLCKGAPTEADAHRPST